MSSTASRGAASQRSNTTGTTESTSGREWEVGNHPRNFQSSARSARIHDVPAASKWASISFYENDPAEIKRHMDIMDLLDRMRCEVRHMPQHAFAASPDKAKTTHATCSCVLHTRLVAGGGLSTKPCWVVVVVQ